MIILTEKDLFRIFAQNTEFVHTEDVYKRQKHGISICIFPEGTRNKGEELSLLPFHNGSFKIAEKTGCPIIPMSLNTVSYTHLVNPLDTIFIRLWYPRSFSARSTR